ncbi:MAG TPA: precorrin-3B C(17)-methyltransferase [Aestuariivirgaceae bacterium]|nr:precorrin-3B C(17)-methyltransferase [Aestuariivirgaceae bacterium]
MVSRPAVIFVTRASESLAHEIASRLDGEVMRGTAALVAAFRADRPIIALCATGIVIRTLSAHLADKAHDPPVVAVAENGSHAVPLLGGHHGANALARTIADLLGGTAAITTASDARFGVALDDPPPGWSLANPEHHKRFASALLDGAEVRLVGHAPWLAGLPLAANAALTIRVAEELAPGSDSELVYVPRTLALGVGCERGTAAAELIALATDALAARNLSTMAVAGVFSLDLKSDEAAVLALGGALDVPNRFFSVEELEAETPRLANPSEIVRREVGVAGVAEAAALAAGGPEAVLLIEKTRSARATLAVAQAPCPLVNLRGRPRGRLSVVGLGPGASAWRSAAAVAALTRATDWVGYALYLDLAADLATGQVQHRFPLGAEADRVRHALTLAGEGHDVALLCSGDAAIYGMASLAAEMLDETASLAIAPACRRVALEIVPGISAFQAASAAAGALIGHDFCCISLSDLMTPWAAIEKRLCAAAQGDFVTALYNPRSLRRRDQLDRAIAILRAHREPSTPVVTASNLGRSGERITIARLCDFDADAVDMLTIVIVGSRQSRSFARSDGTIVAYTPRGYDLKREEPA